jgi:hypothetical protein
VRLLNLAQYHVRIRALVLMVLNFRVLDPENWIVA